MQNQNPNNKAELSSSTLLSLPIKPDIITHLFQQNLLTQEGLLFSWSLINKDYNAAQLFSKLLYYLGCVLVLISTLLLLILNWQHIPPIYQLISYPLLLLGSLLGAWIHHFYTFKAQLFSICAIIITFIGFYDYYSQGLLL